MNTATRTVGSRTLSASFAPLWSALAEKMWAMLIVFSLLLSALSIVYAKDLTRRLLIEVETVQQQSQAEQELWSKLILERSTLTSASRIQNLASRFQMEMPQKNNLIRIKIG